MKKFARVLASSTLKITLFTAAITAGIVGVAGSPNTIKKSLSDSKVYDSLVENVFKEAGKDAASDSSQEGLNIDQPQIKQAAETALPPSTLQNSTEQVIDGVFRWLNGEVDVPNFNVDLTQAKANFITAAGEQAQNHVASLPVCTAQQLREQGGDIDAFAMTCRPANLSAVAAREQFETQLRSNEDFLKDPVITADTLPKDEAGASVFDDLQGAPDAYQRAKTAPWILLGISAALGAVVFFLSETRRRGVKSLGITLAGTGAFLLLTTTLIKFVFNRLLTPEGPIGKSIDNGFQTSVLALLKGLSNAYSKTVLVYSLAYLIVGGAALLALRFIWKQSAVTGAAPAKKLVTK